tara:strand:+ start:164 stop:1027 length:864 start_codon:yes stop_codon:yes gene_type:complete
MNADLLWGYKDLLHAQLCYQLFITPIFFPLEKEYREFARKACEYVQTKRTTVQHFGIPRDHVIHHFAAKNKKQAKKILIAHGWMSRAAYMANLIHVLHQEGFDVYALDFPAHGEAKGLQLPWIDAVAVLKQVINQLGPFYAVIGHSFGGSMLLNTLNMAKQLPEWEIHSEPERVVLMAAPTRMRTPVKQLARQFKLTGKGFLLLREVFRQKTIENLECLDFRHYIENATVPFLCVHGVEDNAITPQESIVFCQHYPYASLELLPGIDHVSILIDKQVEQVVCKFLTN